MLFFSLFPLLILLSAASSTEKKNKLVASDINSYLKAFSVGTVEDVGTFLSTYTSLDPVTSSFFLEIALINGSPKNVQALIKILSQKAARVYEFYLSYLIFLAVSCQEPEVALSLIKFLQNNTCFTDMSNIEIFQVEELVDPFFLEVRNALVYDLPKPQNPYEYLLILACWATNPEYLGKLIELCPDLKAKVNGSLMDSYLDLLFLLDEVLGQAEDNVFAGLSIDHTPILIFLLEICPDIAISEDKVKMLIMLGRLDLLLQLFPEPLIKQYLSAEILQNPASFGFYHTIAWGISYVQYERESAKSLFKSCLDYSNFKDEYDFEYVRTMVLGKMATFNLLASWAFLNGHPEIPEVFLEFDGSANELFRTFLVTKKEAGAIINLVVLSSSAARANQFQGHLPSWFPDCTLNVLVCDFEGRSLLDGLSKAGMDVINHVICLDDPSDDTVFQHLTWIFGGKFYLNVGFYREEPSIEFLKTCDENAFTCFYALKEPSVFEKILVRGALFRLTPILTSNIYLAQTKVYILFGPSQSGKSAFINSVYRLLTPNAPHDAVLAEEGCGLGISQTKECKEYEINFDSGKIVLLDVPGLDDNYYNSSNEDVMNMIKEKVLNHMTALALENGSMRDSIDGIILFEPLDCDRSQIERTMSSARMLFGKGIDESAIIVFTLGDLPYSRLAEEGQKLPSCSWISDQQRPAEETMCDWVKMKFLLYNLEPYRTERIKEVLEEIRVMAKILHDNQPIEYMKLTIPTKIQQHIGDRVIKWQRTVPIMKWRKNRYFVELWGKANNLISREEETKLLPYWTTESSTYTTTDPVYKEVVVEVSGQVPRPLRPLHEFEAEAQEKVAAQIRRLIKEHNH